MSDKQSFTWKSVNAYEACNGTLWRTADEAHAESKLAALAKPQNDAEAGQWSLRDVAEAMTDAWNTICSDTGHHPLDINQVRDQLFFKPAHWAEGTALLLINRATPPSPELPQDDAVAWRFRYEMKDGVWGKWTVQKNKPTWYEAYKAENSDVQVEPLFTAPPSPERMRRALEHARSRFEQLAEEFKEAKDTVSWAMCSTDAGMMGEALRAGDNHNSDGLRKQEETATALEAGSGPIRSACIGPLPCGESPASLLPSEANKSGDA